ncbi:insulin-like growth factor-binding protein complex acid labile subunit [Aethina tumida]|uniref:insulin-like growth factor-binding protein complex acid labile subunit n=1 Tax=Aethina tumida TaxID=116153 RepID=UPI00214768AB|nr:insulin-like growth factor-binding protein complex acid labile subunit [Aethina tumida]
MQAIIVLLLLLIGVTCKSTFKNVQFSGYRLYKQVFEHRIKSSEVLHPYIPNVEYDTIKITNQNIPVLVNGSLSNLFKLDELIIDRNNITQIGSDVFFNLPRLRVLSISDNELSTIDSGTFNKLNVSYLTLSRNKINYIVDSAFDDMPNLIQIDLSENLLNSKNLIRTASFHNLAGVRRFGYVILNLTIDLRHNRLRELHSNIFEGLTNVQELLMDYNFISEVQENVLPHKTEYLGLTHNNISCFYGDLNKVLTAQVVNIEMNPLQCSCYKKIIKWRKRNKHIIKLDKLLQCDS